MIRVDIKVLKATQQFSQAHKFYSMTSSPACYKLAIVGGGAGGCSVAAKFADKLGENAVVVIEPAKEHYYQPMFTLIGGGMKQLKDSHRPMSQVLPKGVEWIQEAAKAIQPAENCVVLGSGSKVHYEYLVVAAGLSLDYHRIPGLEAALSEPDSGVCSNYSPKYVEKTFSSLQKFQQGNLIFTFPNTPVKCAGAPQKICYIAEHFLRLNGKREKATVIYNTSLGVLFGVKKYADELWEVCKRRGINVNLRTSLIEVVPEKKIAVFENLDKPSELMELPFAFLHVTPPMSPATVLKSSPDLVDAAGFLNVDKGTMQHAVFPNVFGIGDCTNAPTAKTAAAVAAQCGIVEDNLLHAMRHEALVSKYDGYTSCPLVTGYNSCILAEFDYNLQPLETFPFNQAKESSLMLHLKKDFMPTLYWNAMLRGYWNGPRSLRNFLRLNLKG